MKAKLGKKKNASLSAKESGFIQPLCLLVMKLFQRLLFQVKSWIQIDNCVFLSLFIKQSISNYILQIKVDVDVPNMISQISISICINQTCHQIES